MKRIWNFVCDSMRKLHQNDALYWYSKGQYVNYMRCTSKAAAWQVRKVR